MKNFINRLWQNILPQHWLSRWGGRVADCKNPAIKNWLCKKAIKAFSINLSEANSQNLEDYQSFNDFFDRYLLPTARPIDKEESVIISPADGVVSEYGRIENDNAEPTLIQTKGKHYSLAKLINDEVLAKEYVNGHYATVYLSPRDYHRVHNPIAGTLSKSEYIAGKLFAVNEGSVNAIDGLFCQNERLICHLDTSIGRVLVIFVGALLVNGIRTKWLQDKPSNGVHSLDKLWSFGKGAELGLFRFGSTVILVFPPDGIQKFSITKEQKIQMGQPLAIIKK
jgi:phosphatidylserine decarboxylase